MSGSWEEDSYTSGLRAGIVQIINNTAKKIKVSLSNAHIDLPGEAGTISRGQAAIDVQGSGEVELKFSGKNTLTGSGRSAGIQKTIKTRMVKTIPASSPLPQTARAIPSM